MAEGSNKEPDANINIETPEQLIETPERKKQINKYDITDEQTKIFKVFVQKINNNTNINNNINVNNNNTNTNNINNNNQSISALKIAEILNKTTNGIGINEIQKAGRNRIIVTCDNPKTANEIVENKLINENGLVAFIPTFLTTRTAVIKQVDTDYSDTALMQNIDAGQYDVKSIDRLTRKNIVNGEISFLPTSTVKITFKGQIMPKFIYIWRLRFECTPYVRKIKQCYKCLRYGHISKQCKSTYERCNRCSSSEHSSDKCTNEETKCANCKQQHRATSRDCPEYNRQQNISKFMAERNLSYIEASMQFPTATKNSNLYSIRTQNRYEILNEEEFPHLTEQNNQIPEYIPPPISKHTRNNLHKNKTSNIGPKRHRTNTNSSSDSETAIRPIEKKIRNIENRNINERHLQHHIVKAQIHKEPNRNQQFNNENISTKDEPKTLQKTHSLDEIQNIETDLSQAKPKRGRPPRDKSK